MLPDADVEGFIANGLVAVRAAFPIDVAARCRDVVWQELAARGVDRHDRKTWRSPVVRIPCPEGGPFVDAGTAPALWEAYDQLIGAGRWGRRRGVGGAIPVRFPSEDDPGDAGWHIDTSFPADGDWWANVRTRDRGLLALFLFTDVAESDAPTRVLVGSHLDVARALEPAGDRGLTIAGVLERLGPRVFERDIALVTGTAGDVYLCHPFTVHAASWPHRGDRPRMMAQPGVFLKVPYALTDAAGAPPVERAILRALGRRHGEIRASRAVKSPGPKPGPVALQHPAVARGGSNTRRSSRCDGPLSDDFPTVVQRHHCVH